MVISMIYFETYPILTIEDIYCKNYNYSYVFRLVGTIFRLIRIIETEQHINCMIYLIIKELRPQFSIYPA